MTRDDPAPPSNRSFLELLAIDASLKVACRDCERSSYPLIGKIALREGLHTVLTPEIVIRCGHCFSTNTAVAVRYPGIAEEGDDLASIS